jgi:anti-sigma factor RsiW
VNIDERLKDMLLFTYVDGEVSEAQWHFVEAVLARDPDARQRIAQIRELNMLIKVAYKGGDQSV